MSTKDCLEEIRQSFAQALSDDQILEVLEEFDAVARATAERQPWANVQEELFGHAQKMAKEARERLLLERRNKAINNLRENRLRNFAAQAAYEKNPIRAVIDKDLGEIGFTAKDGKRSVFAQGTALARFWMGSLDNALRRKDLVKAVSHGALDRQIAQELWELGKTGGRPGVSGSREALDAARIINRMQENMVGRLNRAGAYIRRLPGYIVRQSHDARRIRNAGFQKWYQDIAPKVDERRTFGRLLTQQEHEGVYEAVYNDLAAGRHQKPMGEDDLISSAPFKGAANLAKRLSQSRALHFKSGEGWYEYHSAYGSGTIMENVSQAIETKARAVALMETYGTNPEKMHEGWVQSLNEAAQQAGTRTGDDLILMRPGVLYDIVSGTANMPANQRLSRVMVVARATQILSKLGAVVLSAFSDAPLISNELSRHGVPFVSRATLPIRNLFDGIVDRAEKRRVANMLTAYSEGVSSEVYGRFDMGDGGPGVVSWMIGKFMKYNGLSWWTDVHRGGLARMMSAQMADYLDRGFADLPDDYRRMVEAYGITAEDWTRLADARHEVSGVRYVVPQALGLGEADDAAGRRLARRQRDDLLSKLETFFSDRMDAGVLNPGARERALLLSNSRPGTLDGEILRAVGQFKSFPVAVLNRTWGERLRHGEYASLFATILAMTVMGGISGMSRDVAGGKEPMSPTDPRFWERAFLSGSGAGIFGDFILGEHNRYGRTFVATMAGPLFGQLDSVADIYASAIRGEDAGAKAFRALYTNVPGINLFYIRLLANYLLLYPMQEWLNPGYLRRMERRMEQETGQRFLLSPSETAPAF